MLYIRVELWPQGRKDRARLLQELVIANVGGDAWNGLYKAALSHSTTFKGSGFSNPAAPKNDEIWRAAGNVHHPRKLSPAHLVYAALRELLGIARAPTASELDEPLVRTPDGHINNCALAVGDVESNCQMCRGRCPDHDALEELRAALAARTKE